MSKNILACNISSLVLRDSQFADEPTKYVHMHADQTEN